MRILVLLFLCLVLVFQPASAQIINPCDDMDDEEDRYWCYMDLAVKEKTIKHCNVAVSWANTRECIDEVKKVTTVKVEDCKLLKNEAFQGYCSNYVQGIKQ